jgi:hypothetical protein
LVVHGKVEEPNNVASERIVGSNVNALKKKKKKKKSVVRKIAGSTVVKYAVSRSLTHGKR